MPTPAAAPHLVGKLSLETASGSFLGATRIRLLEKIAEHGSISQAAKAVPMSYKAAWDAIDAMNNILDTALVERSVGGQHGGGTRLTDYGRKVIAMYRAMEQDYQSSLNRLSASLDGPGRGDVPWFKSLMQRLSVQTSARNQLAGRVASLRSVGVNCEVRLRLDEQTELTAIITRESAELLGLHMGREVHALVKAQSVLLLSAAPRPTTASNHLCGEVTRIDPSDVGAEVTLTLPSGRCLTAIVTPEHLSTLALTVGGPVCAAIKANDVILAVFD